MPIPDVRIIVTAVLIQKESGGNLTEILDKVAHLIRERFRLQRQIRVHTAQGRMTGWILSLLPLVLGVVMYSAQPGAHQPALDAARGGQDAVRRRWS